MRLRTVYSAYAVLIAIALAVAYLPWFRNVYVFIGTAWTILVLGALVSLGLAYVATFLARTYRAHGFGGLVDEFRFALKAFLPLAITFAAPPAFRLAGFTLPVIVMPIALFAAVMYANAKYHGRSMARPTVKDRLGTPNRSTQ